MNCRNENELQIRILDLGEMTFPLKELEMTDDPGKMVISPAQAVLISHPDCGYILVDTGNDPAWKETYNEHMKKVYPITRMVTIVEALAAEGLKPADLSYIVLTHMHFDHIGGLGLLAADPDCKAKLLISKAEFEAAGKDRFNPTSAYMDSLCKAVDAFDVQLQETFSFGDDVTFFLQKCHTPGLLGMQITLKKAGTIIFTSDSVYTESADLFRLPPGGAINATNDEFFLNLDELHDRQNRCGGIFFYSHDIKQATEWQNKGWIS